MKHTALSFKVLITMGLISVLSACSNLGYYAQSVSGQMNILMSRTPIEELLQDDSVNTTLKEKLQLVLKARAFASSQLALPDNDSYRTYVDLNRPYVVWNVFAAPEFSTELKEWCFPFAGCVRYKGYFQEQAADEYGQQLRDEEHLDIYVRGVSAYSTLGWFDDPMLNTIVNRSTLSLAGLIFHELAHQQLYIKNDTAFNEGFAVTVELEGIRRWIAQYGSEEQVSEYEARKQRHREFVELVTQTRDELQALYERGGEEADMRMEKNRIIETLRERYALLKRAWDDYAGYDQWFARDINNAQIGAITTYRDYVPALQALLAKHDHDLVVFYREAAKLGELTKLERQQTLMQLLAP